MLNLKKLVGTGAAIIASVAAMSLYTGTAARSSDHQDSPTMANRPAADITDVFLFPSPATPSNVVLAMDTHPLIPGGTGAASSTSFDPAVMYQFKLVHTAAKYGSGANSTPEDTVIQFSVSGTGASQTLTMHGPAAPIQTGTTSTYVSATASQTIPLGQNTTVNVTGADGNTYPVKVYAGPRADPFFFDLAQFFKIIPDRSASNHPTSSATAPPATATSFRGFTTAYNTTNGTMCDTTPAHEFLSSGGADLVNNAAAGFDVMSIIVEMPKALLQLTPGNASANNPVVHLWATTSTTTGT